MSGSVRKPPKDQIDPVERRRERDYKKEAEEENLWESIVQPAFAEFAGTFFYAFMVCLAVTAHDLLDYAIASGLGIAALCISFVNISGGHFNPAISLAAFVSGGLHIVNLLCYLPLQLIGAVLGAAFVKAVIYASSYEEIKGGASVFRGNHLVNGFNDWMKVNNWDTSPYLAMITETLLATMVVMAYLQANVDDRRAGKKKDPMVYGIAIASVTIASFYTAGGGFNPAVSFGSAIVSDTWDAHYIYWVGPMAGAAIASLFFRILLGDEDHRLLC
ncbi:aquaporin-8-like [Lytechinus variegatus]|uniref:aquaporin-8-like n=1 Tax=Lytechinus variegatus TaxID=7654 RepID=UPI001BB2A83C|nr:aquaporin-8-like [Lytechinus variegatus]